MNPQPPVVSVVMPVLDVESTIDQALGSVVGQSLPAWELVVVDDGSTDGTPARLREWAAADHRITVHVDGRNRGISARLNQAVRLSRAPLVARMDGDDICYPDRLATQVAFLDSHPEVDLLGAGEMVFSSDGRARGPRSSEGGHESITADVLGGIPVGHPTWVGRRQWFLEHPYDPQARGCEDQELLLRAHLSSRYANLPDVLLGYREDRIKLRRSLDTRLAQGAFLLRWGRRNGRLVPAAVAAGGQLARGVRDLLAVALRRQDAVLTRRVRSPDAEELAAWTRAWDGAVSAGVCVSPGRARS